MHDPAVWGARPEQHDNVQRVPLALVDRGATELAIPAKRNSARTYLTQLEKRGELARLRIIVGGNDSVIIEYAAARRGARSVLEFGEAFRRWSLT